mmetsp:Transcript_14977/g.24890  ORF Transcript_14977/g.24890 Transcript_14977/m.24890 type:complete len:134 (+) Transcript_14977:118-519(+)
MGDATEDVKAAIRATHSFTGDYGRGACTEDFSYIRPSGNPLTMDGFQGMCESSDLEWKTYQVWSFDDVKFFAGGNACAVMYRSHQTFSYKGSPNDDVATCMSVLEKDSDGKWLVLRTQRAQGQKPEDAPPKSE